MNVQLELSFKKDKVFNRINRRNKNCVWIHALVKD